MTKVNKNITKRTNVIEILSDNHNSIIGTKLNLLTGIMNVRFWSIRQKNIKLFLDNKSKVTNSKNQLILLSFSRFLVNKGFVKKRANNENKD